MRFTLSGIQYETDEMEACQTPGSMALTIFIDRDCQVFVMTPQDGGELEIHQAMTPEIVELAETHGIEELWRAIRCPEPFN